jgi:2-polyprenyl-6-methoxyphenol hydroxylase-like FAD-dependent oxidoreductase
MAALRKVLIVGAGIVGQILACALAKRGIETEIVEIKSDFQIAGAGMMLQGTALRALRNIGVVEEVAAAGWHDPARPIVFLDTQGAIVFAPPERNIVGDGFPPSVAIRRQVLHEVLNTAVRRAGIPVKMATTVKHIAEFEDRVGVGFTDGTVGGYDLVVGCDGIRSKIRALTFPGIEPEFTGFCILRAILPRPASIERVTWMWGHGKYIGLLPVGDTQIYVAGVSKAASSERPAQETLAELFRRKFTCFGGPMMDVLGRELDPDDFLYTVIEQVNLPAPWYKGRVLVMGDAAHAAPPFWAQGAAMGIEDAIALSLEIEKGDEIEPTLARWFERRYERAKFVREGSLQTGQALMRDVESDDPTVFPPEVREQIAQENAKIAARLAEPF